MADLQNPGNVRIPSFHEYDPEAVKSVEKAYEHYATYIATIEKGGELTQPFDQRFTEADIKFTETGSPVVLPESKNKCGNETQRMQADKIRAFITVHYRESGYS